MDKKELLEPIVESLDKHKALDIRVLDVSGITSVADYFIIATGTSSTHLRSLADYVDDDLAERGIPLIRTEGYRSANWILLDYGDAVVHLFSEQSREFYDLERLWKDGVPVSIQEYLDREDNGQ